MSVLAWHFVGETLRDGRPVPLDSEWLVHEGRAVMCESGLHASLDPFDALEYAPASVLCRVECDDVVETGIDKLVCCRRRIIQRRNVTDMLRRFAREQALSVIHLWDAPEVVVTYLRTGDEAIWAAAQDAAGAAARAAAQDAARAAAQDAAWAAARAAAWAAAWAAAQDAAWAAAQDAAWAAARAAARHRFNEMVNEEFGLEGKQ